MKKRKGIQYLKITASWMKSRINRGAVILGYHRVSEPDNDSFGLSVSKKNFAEQMEVLKELVTPASILDIVEDLKEGQDPIDKAAVTFDDGYVDNLFNAKPILNDLRIPATVFAVAGALGQEFWWDRLERILMMPSKLPKYIRLIKNNREVRIKVRSASNPSERIRLTKYIYRILRPMDRDEREKSLHYLETIFAHQIEDSPEHRAMNSEELVDLMREGLFDVGGHTMNHTDLTNLSDFERELEIKECKNVLETILENSIVGFSYPNGSTSSKTERAVSEAGFLYACASEISTVSMRTNIYRMPRLWVGNYNGSAFRRYLARWL